MHEHGHTISHWARLSISLALPSRLRELLHEAVSALIAARSSEKVSRRTTSKPALSLFDPARHHPALSVHRRSRIVPVARLNAGLAALPLGVMARWRAALAPLPLRLHWHQLRRVRTLSTR
jgi:hypothetical protein